MIDVAMLDCQLAIWRRSTHWSPARRGSGRGTRTSAVQAFATRDGRPIVVCAGHDDLFAAFCAAIAVPTWRTTISSATRTAAAATSTRSKPVQPVLATPAAGGSR
jgi:crotonobetainyl-CoA:carnitine CoA-transferase CaiB-like acyl-CoA transferase